VYLQAAIKRKTLLQLVILRPAILFYIIKQAVLPIFLEAKLVLFRPKMVKGIVALQGTKAATLLINNKKGHLRVKF
jgi:hypothetical protein